MMIPNTGQTFGSTIDKALAEQVRVIRDFLQSRSGTGKSPPMLRNVRAGRDIINIRGEGISEVVERPFTITPRDDGSHNVQIKARSEEHLAELIPHVAAALGISDEQMRDQLKGSEARMVAPRPGQVHFPLTFGGPDVTRSMTKSCIELWATLVGNDEVKLQPYAAARNFVLMDDMEFLEYRVHLDSRPLPHLAQFITHFGDFFNLVYVRSDGNGRVIGHFTLYNVLGWQTVLAESGGQPNVAIGLASNPLDPRAWSDTIATDIEIDSEWLDAPVLEDHTHGQARLAAMVERYSRQSLERAIEEIIKSVFKRHGETMVSGENIRKQIFAQISQRVALHLMCLPYEQRLEPNEIEAMLLPGKKPHD
jgi:hypothetical protein